MVDTIGGKRGQRGKKYAHSRAHVTRLREFRSYPFRKANLPLGSSSSTVSVFHTLVKCRERGGSSLQASVDGSIVRTMHNMSMDRGLINVYCRYSTCRAGSSPESLGIRLMSDGRGNAGISGTRMAAFLVLPGCLHGSDHTIPWGFPACGHA